jgi:hypothetical protein
MGVTWSYPSISPPAASAGTRNMHGQQKLDKAALDSIEAKTPVKVQAQCLNSWTFIYFTAIHCLQFDLMTHSEDGAAAHHQQSLPPSRAPLTHAPADFYTTKLSNTDNSKTTSPPRIP